MFFNFTRTAAVLATSSCVAMLLLLLVVSAASASADADADVHTMDNVQASFKVSEACL